jgi:hypothetical protein
MHRVLTLVLSLLAGSASSADYLLVLDPTRLDRAVAGQGAGPDGRPIRPGNVAAACLRDGVFGPAAYSPRLDACRSLATLSGLSEALAGLGLTNAATDVSILGQVDAGGIVAVLPRRQLACIPGECSRDLFENASYPVQLVGRPLPDPLAEPSITQLQIQPATIQVGQTATLSWTAVGVAGCQLEAAEGSGTLDVSTTGQLDVTPIENSVWTLICAGPGGADVAQAAVSVTPANGSPEILLFSASRDDVPVGGATRLIWEVRNAEICRIDNGEAVLQVPAQGRLRVTVVADTVFELRCLGDVGEAVSRTEVLVTTASQAPVIESFNVDRSAIERGDNAFLSWNAPAATRCQLLEPNQNLAWRLPARGRIKTVPAVSSDFTLDCRNAFGADTAQTLVSVVESSEPLRILTFELDPLDPSAGQEGEGRVLGLMQPGLVRLSWATQGAKACRIASDSGLEFPVRRNGNRLLRLEETTALQIQCAARGAEAQAFGRIEVIEELVFADDFQD